MTKHRRTVAPATLQLFSINPPSNGAQPLGSILGPYSFPGNSVLFATRSPGTSLSPLAEAWSVGERMEEEQGQGRVGSRIRRDRWPPVDDRKWAQEGGHRGPDTRPGDDRRADREGGRRSREIDRGAIPSDACNAISRRAVCPSVRSCMPLTPLFLLPSFSHTKVNIPAIRMEYNAILSGYNRPGDALYRADLAHTSASILGGGYVYFCSVYPAWSFRREPKSRRPLGPRSRVHSACDAWIFHATVGINTRPTVPWVDRIPCKTLHWPCLKRSALQSRDWIDGIRKSKELDDTFLSLGGNGWWTLIDPCNDFACVWARVNECIELRCSLLAEFMDGLWAECIKQFCTIRWKYNWIVLRNCIELIRCNEIFKNSCTILLIAFFFSFYSLYCNWIKSQN